MKLCPIAWQIARDGRIPLKLSTPKIVEECGKKQHNELLNAITPVLKKDPNTLYYVSESSSAISFYVNLGDEWREIRVKPDAYVLYRVGGNLIVNLVVEVTTRSRSLISEEWLTAYALGYYLRNLRPTFVLLVRIGEVCVIPLSTERVERLKRLLAYPPLEKGKESREWLCSNCDLRPVCPAWR